MFRILVRQTMTFLLVLPVLLFSASSAFAQPVAQPAVPDYTGFMGCPSVDWLSPVVTAFGDVTAMIIGLGIVLLLMFIVGLFLILGFTGKNQDKATSNLQSLKWAGISLVALSVGIPVIAILLGAFSVAFCN